MESDITLGTAGKVINQYNVALLLGGLSHAFVAASKHHRNVQRNLRPEDTVVIDLFKNISDMDLLVQSREYVEALIKSSEYHKIDQYLNQGFISNYIFKLKEMYEIL